MICFPCGEGIHEHCEDSNCPCQHKPTVTLVDAEGNKMLAPLDSEAAQTALQEEKGKTL